MIRIPFCTLYYFFILLLACVFNSCSDSNEKLLIFAGSVSKPATEEMVAVFEKETGIKAEIIFGGSGYVLSQMIVSKKGDIYFPGSSDYMETAKAKGIVYPETEKIICYLIPAINVKKGNPENILCLQDLLRNDIKVAIANPEGVCSGIYAVEIVENSFDINQKNKFKNNLLNYTGSCSKTATSISLGIVDAVIGWRIFQYWDTKNIETVKLKKDEIIRIGYIPVAVSKFTDKKENAKKFIKFMASKKGRNIFEKYGYFTSKQDAFDFIGEEKPVGGYYKVPKNWITK